MRTEADASIPPAPLPNTPLTTPPITEPVRVGTGFAQTVIFVYLLCFGAGTIGCIVDKMWGVMCLYLLFDAFGLFAQVYGIGTIIVDPAGISFRTLRGRYRLRWVDIKSAASAKGNLVLQGDKGRLALPVPSTWSGKEKERAGQALRYYLDQQGIRVQRKKSAAFMFSKGCMDNASSAEGILLRPAIADQEPLVRSVGTHTSDQDALARPVHDTRSLD